MDKTVRTIRKAIEEAGKGVLPTIVLIVDTNILADIGWTRDQNTVHLIEYAARFPKLFVCCPRISAIEFKRITQSEVQSLKRFREDFNKVFSEIKRYEIGDVDKILEGFSAIKGHFDELIDKLQRAPLYVLDKLSAVLYIFEELLPIQHTMAYYVSSDPEYNLKYNDALVFSFVKLVVKALESENKVLFLTKDKDFDVEKVLKELRETNVEIYLKTFLKFDSEATLMLEMRFIHRCFTVISGNEVEAVVIDTMGLDNRKKNILATYHGRYHKIGIADLRAVSTDMKPIHSSGCCSTDSEAMNMVSVMDEVQRVCGGNVKISLMIWVISSFSMYQNIGTTWIRRMNCLQQR
jgi:hypothetical protein